MDRKKLWKVLLFPHIAIMIVLFPVSTVFLVYSLVFLGTKSMVAIVSYVLAFYTLMVWCFKIPRLIEFFKSFKEGNRYIKIWQNDAALRINIMLYGSLIWNTSYALLHIGMGFWHRSFWFFSLAGYYISLAVMRFFLVRHLSKHKSGESIEDELRRYRACGWIFLLMNLALTLIIFFMLYWNRTFTHHMITAIAMATYTFTSFTFSIINMIKYRRYNSPVFSASVAISFAKACVSMLTLSATMLTTFGDKGMDMLSRKILLGSVGVAVSVIVVAMAIYMIIQGTKRMNKLRKEKGKPNG